jgi:hypothetical protein
MKEGKSMSSIKLSQEDTKIVEDLRVIADLSFEQMNRFFLAFISLILGNYSENKPTHMPLLGDITVKYIKDEISSQGKSAILNISVSPDVFLRRVIGQFEDSKRNGDYSNSDLVKLLLSVTQNKLSQELEMSLEE